MVGISRVAARAVVPLWVWWLLALSMSLIIALALPWHMDEFVMYRAYACWSPLQQWNDFGESCTSYPTSLGPIEFSRSYTYIGIASSLLIAPLAALLPFVWMPPLLGIGVLALGAWGLQRGFRLGPAAVPAFMLVFPIAFAVIHDSGPVRLSFLTLCWTPVLLGAFIRTGHWRWVIALAAAWAVSAEDKPFFVFLMPGVAILAVAAVMHQGLSTTCGRCWSRTAIALAGGAAAAVALLLVTQVPTGSYLATLVGAAPGQDPATRGPGALSGLFLLVDWAYSGHRITFNTLNNVGGSSLLEAVDNRLPDIRSLRWVLGSLFTLLSIAAPLALVALCIRWRSHVNRTVVLCVCAGVALFIGAVVPGGWALHHFVFAQVPLAVAGAVVLTGVAARAAAILLAGGSVSAALGIATLPQQPYAGYEVNAVVTQTLAAADPSSVVNCADWGCYFPGAFIARNRVPVVFANTPQFAAVLEERARGANRVIRHACAFCELEQVQAAFANSTVTPQITGGDYWRVYRVTPHAPKGD